MKTTNLQIQEAQQIPSSVNSKKDIPTHIMKLLRTKKISKTARIERYITYREITFAVSGISYQKPWMLEDLGENN